MRATYTSRGRAVLRYPPLPGIRVCSLLIVNLFRGHFTVDTEPRQNGLDAQGNRQLRLAYAGPGRMTFSFDTTAWPTYGLEDRDKLKSEIPGEVGRENYSTSGGLDFQQRLMMSSAPLAAKNSKLRGRGTGAKSVVRNASGVLRAAGYQAKPGTLPQRP